MGRIWLINVIRISLQCMGNKRNPGENRPWIAMRCRWASSRFQSTQMNSIYTPGSRIIQNIKKGIFYRKQDFNAPALLKSAQGSWFSAQQNHNNSARAIVAVCCNRIRVHRVHKFCVIAADTTDSKHLVIMDRSEDCLHCKDLQVEFEALRAQQRILEDQVKSLETRMEDQYRVLNEKYRA